MRAPRPLIFLLALVITSFRTLPVRFPNLRVQIDQKPRMIGQPVVITYQVTTEQAKQPDWDVTDDFFRKTRFLLFLQSSTVNVSSSLTQHTILATALRPFTGEVGPTPILMRGAEAADTLYMPPFRLTFNAERPEAALHPIRDTVDFQAYVNVSPGQLLVGGGLVFTVIGAMAWWLAKPKYRTVAPAGGGREASLAKLADLECAVRGGDYADPPFADQLFHILTDILGAERRSLDSLHDSASLPRAPVNPMPAESTAPLLRRLEQMRFSETMKIAGEQTRLLQEVREAINLLAPSRADQPLT